MRYHRLLTGIILFFNLSATNAQTEFGDSWANVLSTRKGQVIFYWFPNNTKVNQSRDVMDGVEHALGNDMIDYLNERYNVQIEAKWVQSGGFSEVLETISQSRGGTFGTSSISYTKERSEVMNFSPYYFPDIAVLVSSGNIPISLNEEHLKQSLNGITAVTIANTTLERGLLRLKDSLKIDFKLEYVDNGGAVIEKIEELGDAFGYADLSNYLSSLPRSPNIKRQVFHPMKLTGLGIIYPKGSDWKPLIEQYFQSERFEEKRTELVARYLGKNVDELIERISQAADIGPVEEIAMLAEEVELRYKDQLATEIKAQKQQNIRNALIAGVIVLLFIATLFGIRFQLKSAASKALSTKQAEIESQNQLLQDLNTEKNNLIQVLAHDLRSPISHILGFTSILKNEQNIRDDQKQMLEYISQASDRLKDMIGKIMDVEAIESGKLNVKREEVDIRQILNQVVTEFEPRAKKKNISLNGQIPESNDLKAIADRIYLTQVLENLVSNALKFSFPDTEILVKGESDNSHINISVSDQGPGFSEDDEARIFKKYQQLSARSTAGESSTGLGLSIVKSFTEKMGGSVHYETTLGKGTTFYVSLKRTAG